MTNLPSWDEIARNAAAELTRARNALAEARDWLNSDWKPGTELTDDQAAARSAVLRWIGETKGEIDGLKNQLQAR